MTQDKNRDNQDNEELPGMDYEGSELELEIYYPLQHRPLEREPVSKQGEEEE